MTKNNKKARTIIFSFISKDLDLTTLVLHFSFFIYPTNDLSQHQVATTMFRFLRRNSADTKSREPADSSSGDDDTNKKAPGATVAPITPKTPRNGQRNNKLAPSPISASTEREYHAARLTEIIALTMADDVEGLKPFDSCIEASDTLASTSTPIGRGGDNSTGLLDCSVLISADGDLLIIPQQQNDASNKIEEEGMRKNWCWKQNTELGEEYDSAVFLGNDLPDLGDKTINGFSAKGWSTIAASLALKQSADSMGDLSRFLGELVEAKKSSAEQNNKTIDKLRSMVGVQQSELKASKVVEYQKYLQDKFSAENLNLRGKQRNFRMKIIKNQRQQQEQNIDLEVSPDRVGPLNQSGGTISATLNALENFYSLLAESELKRLRNMTERSGALTKLQDATMKTEERVRCRQFALQETMSRMKTMEDYLQKCKADAKTKWDKVHKTELTVTRLVEEKMMEQNMLREEERKKQMEKDQAQQTGGSEEKLGTSNSEIWDIVTAAKSSMEEGSFAPLVTRSSTTSSVVTDEESPTVSSTAFAPSEEMELEMDSRYEFEVMYRLPELRILAVAADGAVEDAATFLLSILSTWDTTSRSAQVAAETCLVSSGNAQASCLRSIIAMERESMEERLKFLEELESVANEIDVRADVDQYITVDKAKQGCRSYRGEYYDGGIASALNHLHFGDQEVETDGEIEKKDSNNDDEIEEELEDHSAITSEYIEERLECLFRNDSPPKEELEANVVKLCAIGKVKSPKYATRRSTICYAMNAKRSTAAQISSIQQFDGLCRVFAAVLSGCDTNEDSGISSALLLMDLSEHFHIQVDGKEKYVKSRLAGHLIWDEDAFWDRALHQTITEKLNYNCVLSNFERDSRQTMMTENKERSEWTETPKTRWHDLTEAERYQAASQVNAVVFAQVSAMTDSMLGLCGKQEKTSAFVRRVCVNNQLPMSQRTALLRHLTGGSYPASNDAK